MEVEIVKYFVFMISSVLAVGITLLWLKSNRLKRKKNEEANDRLEMEKEIRQQIMREQNKNK